MYINIYHHALIEGPFILNFHLTYHTHASVELKIVKPIALNTYQLSVIYGTVKPQLHCHDSGHDSSRFEPDCKIGVHRDRKMENRASI